MIDKHLIACSFLTDLISAFPFRDPDHIHREDMQEMADVIAEMKAIADMIVGAYPEKKTEFSDNVLEFRKR